MKAKYQTITSVYYRIDTPNYNNSLIDYSEKASKLAEKSVALYYEEITNIFISLGWQKKARTLSCSCPEFVKGHQTAYCHPQSISGLIENQNIDAIEAVLKGASSFKWYKTDRYEEVIVINNSDEEKQLYIDVYNDTIDQILQGAFTTKRCTLYKLESAVLWKVYEQIKIKTTFTPRPYPKDIAFEFIFERYEQLKSEGWIKTGVNNNGEKIARWLNKAETKQKTKAA